VAQGESLDVVEEEAQVAEAEALLAAPHPGVGVAEAPACVMGSLLLQAGMSARARCRLPALGLLR
jgi:hypothetical protein